MTTEQLLPVPPVTGGDACPTCGGRGEVEVGLRTRNEWGVWDVEFRTCTTCAGSGVIPEGFLVCDECTDVYPFEDQVCEHGASLCGDCRGCCSECAVVIEDDRRADYR